MSTGTGIFLAGLIIGLVMLYGQTKDRWDWVKILKYAGITVGSVIYLGYFYISNDAKNWDAFKIDWSGKNIFFSAATVFFIGVIAIAPHYVVSWYFEHVLHKDFQFDEDWNEREIYKYVQVFFQLVFFILVGFYFDEMKIFVTESISRKT